MRGGKLIEHSAKKNEENRVGGRSFKQGLKPNIPITTKHALPNQGLTFLETVPEYESNLQVGGQRIGLTKSSSPTTRKVTKEGYSMISEHPQLSNIERMPDSTGTYTISKQSTEQFIPPFTHQQVFTPIDISSESSQTIGVPHGIHGGIITGVGIPERSIPASRPGYSAIESVNDQTGHVKVHLVDVSVASCNLISIDVAGSRG